MAKYLNSTERRAARVRRSLRKVAGERARLSVFRSSKHIYAQIIDDANG
jgi:large subunit ribosomal protein L18